MFAYKICQHGTAISKYLNVIDVVEFLNEAGLKITDVNIKAAPAYGFKKNVIKPKTRLQRVLSTIKIKVNYGK